MTSGKHYTDIEQGTPEWHALRCGKVTASRVADIMRRTKTGVSASRDRYAGELVAERLTGQVAPSFKSADMEWGNATEQDARNAYAFSLDTEALASVAFVDHPLLRAGASPDRLVGDVGLVEIKCPATHTHISTLRGAPIDPDYATQMMWQMDCTGRAWCDFVSYDPRMPPDMRLHVTRVYRDSVRIVELAAAVEKFITEVDAAEAELLSKYRSEAA